MLNPSFAAIEIPFDPNISGGSSLALSWHGFLSFVAVAVAVWLVARAARQEPAVTADMVYNTSIWGIIGGIIGARVVHVADNWDVAAADIEGQLNGMDIDHGAPDSQSGWVAQ